METDDDQKDSRESRIAETLDRLAKRIDELPPDRKQALDELLDESKSDSKKDVSHLPEADD